MKDEQKKLLNICVWITVILFVVRCVISWENILKGFSAYDMFGYASEAISLAVILTGLYEKFLWRYNPFERTPKLHQKYYGIIKSDFDGIERKATLEIKQSLLSVHVFLTTDESKSKSITASIEEVLGENQLTYCYMNQPKYEFRKHSEIHNGTAVLSIIDNEKLEGQYYTDRKTIGDMRFEAEEK